MIGYSRYATPTPPPNPREERDVNVPTQGRSEPTQVRKLGGEQGGNLNHTYELTRPRGTGRTILESDRKNPR